MHALSVVRNIVLNVFFLMLVLGFLTVLLARPEAVPDHAILVFKPEGALVEQRAYPTGDALPLVQSSPKQVVLSDVIDALKAAKTDSNIGMLQLDLQHLDTTSLAKLQSLRAAILDFKTSGKPVIAAAESYSQAQYYLAATADDVFLHPMGLVMMQGFSVYRNYYKSLLDKLHVDVHVFRAGEYKSAAEPLLRDSMSAEDRAINAAWLQDLWQMYKDDVAQLRDVEASRMQYILDHLSTSLQPYHGSIAQLLKAEGLVDDLVDVAEAESRMDAMMAERYRMDTDDVARVDMQDYWQYYASKPQQDGQDHVIAVVTASGAIVSGQQPAGSVGSETMLALLRHARLEDNIKAVVLRIDSPGGSALASEVIRQEVLRVQDAGKPVVVSMGSVAASGGYWIAANADEIWAQPGTITGSIGVFGLMMDVSQGLNRMGVYTDGLGTSDIAEGVRVDRALHSELSKVLQMGVDHVYQDFITLVADARKMSVEEVDAIARGRVWSGVDAQQAGLVDQLGDVQDAIDSVAQMLSLGDDYDILYLVPQREWLDVVMDSLWSEASVWLGASQPLAHWQSMWSSVTEPLQGLQFFAHLNDPAHVYAYADFSYQ